jgi:hypothetical protein
VAEPILEARRTEARVFAKGEALIVNLYAVVERMHVRNHLAWVAVCAQETPDQVIHSDRFGTGYLDPKRESPAPITGSMRLELLTSDYIQADETPLMVQVPGLGRNHRAHLWQYSRPRTGAYVHGECVGFR